MLLEGRIEDGETVKVDVVDGGLVINDAVARQIAAE
jgi:hypothetical protein